MSKTNLLTHEQIKDIFSCVYNQFYLKWRIKDKRVRTDEEIELMLNEADSLREKFNHCTLVDGMLNSLIEQFSEEERMLQNDSGKGK